ncbi:SRPBCC family protein [Sphingosinicella sp. CPCC 101087]|uniref:SRPBCC family protein n=1 Tax=Sphingosinicella sp. CPCC 101087 TaxID=2497754 RepID=UPI00101DD46E|nr:SRPBCC family protein [Sphingosinicella sp. CPCC 101087]
MTDSGGARVDSASRLVLAPPDAIYRAFIDPEALVRWLPPASMTGRIDRFEPRPGGRFDMTLTYDEPGAATHGKSSEDSDIVRGRFVELDPGRRIVQIFAFDSPDPAFAGEMRMTWAFEAEAAGTRVTVHAQDVPSGIGPKDHELGMRSSLENLAAFVERRDL